MPFSDVDSFKPSDDDVAIVGFTGRFPGASNVDEFWRNLVEGVVSMTTFSDDELDEAGVPAAEYRDPRFVRAGYIIDNADKFDAEFFGITPREARILDPQQRLFLECAWETFEHAGHDPEDFDGTIGVFAGTGPTMYMMTNLAADDYLGNLATAWQVKIANDKDYVALRVGYKLNLRGPCVTVQTACSTSLVATHLACQSLLNHECDMALAGGVSLLLPQRRGYLYQEGMIVSADGKCRAFDAGATGVVRGNGVAAVLLRRLPDALADGDTIHAVIRGSAVTNDGATKVGFAAPSVEGQRDAILQALAVARVSADTVTYVEAHGLGTELGDSVEVEALKLAFAASTSRRQFCALGSVKTNVGHLDAAAGVAGLIKTALMLEHRTIVPSLNFERPNEHIDLENSPFYIARESAEWEPDEHPRRAGVTSNGGTNAHVILEEPPPSSPTSASREHQLVLLSARTQAGLEQTASRLARHLRERPDVDLADVAHTLRVGRRRFAHRCAVVCRESDEAAHALEIRDAPLLRSVGSDLPRSVVFMFPAEGTLDPRMAHELAREEPSFARDLAASADLFEAHLGRDLQAAPTLFAIEYALARLWMSWGVCPTAIIGDGIGVLVAACLADVFTLEDAVPIVAAQDRLMRELEPDTMLAVDSAKEQLESPTIDPSLHELAACVARARLSPPQIPFVSNVTAALVDAATATDPAYWARELRSSVGFAEALATVLEDDVVLLEVGPGNALSTLARRHPAFGERHEAIHSLPQIDDADPAPAVLASALARLWLAGASVDWKAYVGAERRRRVPLPTYTWQRERYWTQPPRRPGVESVAGAKTGSVGDWLHVPSWRRAAPVIGAPNELAARPRRWLVVRDDAGAIDCVLPPLPANQAVTVVKADAAVSYQSLLDDLFERNQAPDVVLYAGALGVPDQIALERAYHNTASLAQALAARRQSARLVIVTDGVGTIESADRVTPLKATVRGLVRALVHELDGIEVRLLDVRPGDAQLGAAVAAECVARDDHVLVALRGASRWVEAFERFPLEAGPLLGLRDRGTYLVTGGLGSLGSTVAQHLACRVGARLVLTTSLRLPDRDDWDAITARGDGDRVGAAVRRLREIEAAGSEVVVVQLDLADPTGAEAALRAALDPSGHVDGIVHAAGIAGAASITPLSTLSRADAERHFTPKLFGAELLRRIVADTHPDFCLLMSSLASVVGGRGLSACAAANAFLDALPESEHGGTRWIAVGWERFLLDNETSPALSSGIGRYALDEAEALDVFDRIVASAPAGHVIVCTGDLETRRAAAPTPREIPDPGTDGDGASAAPLELGTEPVPTQDELERTIASVWACFLGVDRVGVHDNFFDVGGTSLLAVEIVEALRRQLGREIPIAKLFEAPTVAALARLLASGADEWEPLGHAERRGMRREALAARRRAPDESRQDETEEVYT